MSPTIRSRRFRTPKRRRCEKLADILKRIAVPKEAGPDAKQALANVRGLLGKADEATELMIRELIACMECTVPGAYRSRVRGSLRRLSEQLHELMDLRDNAAYLIGRAIGGREG